METMVRARSLNGYFQVVRRLGFNPQEALRQVGLDPAKLADTEQLVPVVATCQLMEVTAASAPCPTLGLQMAEARQELDFGVLACCWVTSAPCARRCRPSSSTATS